jgi:hypothetical protein
MRGAWQDQQQLNLAQLDGMQSNSRSSSSGDAGDDVCASTDGDAAAAAGQWILHDVINFMLMRSFIDSIDSAPTASDSTAASFQYSNKHSTAYNGKRAVACAAAAAAADEDDELLQAAEALQDSKLREHLQSCFGPRCCTALTAWVLLWHCRVEEAGGDYSCVKTR